MVVASPDTMWSSLTREIPVSRNALFCGVCYYRLGVTWSIGSHPQPAGKLMANGASRDSPDSGRGGNAEHKAGVPLFFGGSVAERHRDAIVAAGAIAQPRKKR
jgi:hypothetical protein